MQGSVPKTCFPHAYTYTQTQCVSLYRSLPQQSMNGKEKVIKKSSRSGIIHKRKLNTDQSIQRLSPRIRAPLTLSSTSDTFGKGTCEAQSLNWSAMLSSIYNIYLQFNFIPKFVHTTRRGE